MELTTPFEYPAGDATEEVGLKRAAQLDVFLRDVEARAFRIAQITVRDRDEALDIVQDTMLRLATRYSDRPVAEWAPLFFRILANRIRDWRRRQVVRARVLSFFGGQEESDRIDPIATAPASPDDEPIEILEGREAVEEFDSALRQLPERQRQAFVLRNFEDLDVKETAQVMGCSDGSVKTHYSRAVSRLRELLGEHWQW
jgi:RNA polymerase sigma-70 factor (ECF subfamily)